MGKCLGVAFQLQDDILEIFGEEKVIGKSLGSDIIANKKTIIENSIRFLVLSFTSDWLFPTKESREIGCLVSRCK